jgi:hypothetical protein
LNDDVGFSEIFVEEHDIGIDMLTKIQPNPVWHLRDKIKTPVRCELAEKEHWRLDSLQTLLVKFKDVRIKPRSTLLLHESFHHV